MLDEKELQSLLRLKRYERPSDPRYFESFLEEFRNRQRADYMRTPLRTMVIERIEGMVADFRIPRAAYGGALAAFALVVFGIFLMPGPDSTGGVSSPVSRVESVSGTLAGIDPSQRSGGVPGHSGMILDGTELPNTAEAGATYASYHGATEMTPRYVLDSRPVSYDPPFRF